MFVHNWPRRAEATIMVYTCGDLPGDSTGGEVAVYSCLVLCVSCRPAGRHAEENVHQVGQLVPRQGYCHLLTRSLYG